MFWLGDLFTYWRIYKVATSGRRGSRSRSNSPNGDRYIDHSRDRHTRRSRSPSRDRYRSRSPHRRRSHSRSRRDRSSSSRYHSRSPESHDEADTITDTFIRAVAAEVKGHDAKYEDALKGFEKNNPKFKFLLRRDVGFSIFSYHKLIVRVWVIAQATCFLSWACGV